MAYKRGAKKSYKKKSYKKKAPQDNLAVRVAKTAGHYGLKILKNKLGLNTEQHFVDVLDTAATATTTLSAMGYPLTIPIGDNVNSRTGSSIRIQSYRVKGFIKANAAMTVGCLVRIVFTRNANTRGTTVIASAFMDSNTRVTSFYNRGDSINATGYSILYDKTFFVGTWGSEHDNVQFEFDYTPTEHHVKFDNSGTAGGVAETIDGYLRGWIMSTETVNFPVYTADHRLTFVDN